MRLKNRSDLLFHYFHLGIIPSLKMPTLTFPFVRRCDCFIFPEGIKRDSFFDELEETEQAKSNPTPKQSAPVSNYTVNDEEEINKNFNKKGE